MTDIVARLHEWLFKWPHVGCPDRLIESAAKEIENLREKVAVKEFLTSSTPMCVDEINDLAWMLNVWNNGTLSFDYVAFARAVEKHHGIKWP